MLIYTTYTIIAILALIGAVVVIRFAMDSVRILVAPTPKHYPRFYQYQGEVPAGYHYWWVRCGSCIVGLQVKTEW